MAKRLCGQKGDCGPKGTVAQKGIYLKVPVVKVMAKKMEIKLNATLHKDFDR